MKKTTVYVRHLNAPYQEGTRTVFKPLTDAMREEIRAAVRELFDKAGGSGLLKSSRNVFLKPNGIDGQPYCYTRPELVEAVIEYWKEHGAEKIYLEAQTYAIGYYAKEGFQVVSGEFLEDGIPHVKMERGRDL